MEVENVPSSEPSPARGRKVRILIAVGIILAFCVCAYYLPHGNGTSEPVSEDTDSGLSEDAEEESVPVSAEQSQAAEDPTADWATYRSEKWGITFKYPKYLTVNQDIPSYVHFRKAAEETTGDGEDAAPSYFWMTSQPMEGTLASYLALKDETAEIEPLAAGNNEFTKVHDPTAINEVYSYCIMAGDRLFLFETVIREPDADFKRILSSVRFLSQESTDVAIQDTSSWKTYRSEKYGFEVKYPAGWFVYEEAGAVYFQAEKEESDEVPGPHAGALSIERWEYGGKSIADDAISLIVGEQPYSTEGVKIGKENALEIKTICEGVGCGAPQWLIIKDRYLYHFDSHLGYCPEFDGILSTFQLFF